MQEYAHTEAQKNSEIASAVQDPEYAHLIHRRIIFNKNFGRVRYAGKLQHELDSDKINKSDIWLGVEWEDEANGKPNAIF